MELDDDNTTIGALISRFRQAPPASPRSRSTASSSLSNDKPDLWWKHDTSDDDEDKNPLPSSSLRPSLSIDQLIATDIQSTVESSTSNRLLSPIRSPVEKFLGQDRDLRQRSSSPSSSHYFPKDSFYEKPPTPHKFSFDDYIDIDDDVDSLDEAYDELMIQNHINFVPMTYTQSQKQEYEPETPRDFASEYDRGDARFNPKSREASDAMRNMKLEISERLNVALLPFSEDSTSGYNNNNEYHPANLLNNLSPSSLPLSAQTIATDLESALSLIGNKYSNNSNIQENAEENKYNNITSTTNKEKEKSDMEHLVNQEGASSSSDLEDILDRLELKSAERLAIKYKLPESTPSSPPSSPKDNLIQEKVKNQNDNIMQQQLQKEDHENNAMMSFPTAEEVGRVNESIQESLDITLMKLRNSLDVDAKEAREKAERKKKQEIIDSAAQRKKVFREEKLQKAKHDEEMAKRRVMGSSTLIEEPLPATSNTCIQHFWAMNDPHADLPPSFDHQQSLQRFDALAHQRVMRQREKQTTTSGTGTQTDPETVSIGTDVREGVPPTEVLPVPSSDGDVSPVTKTSGTLNDIRGSMMEKFSTYRTAREQKAEWLRKIKCK